jgi:hypothetical protein
MWQSLVVGLIVLVATTYAAWALVPAGTRLRIASRFYAWTRGAGRPAWLGRIAAAMERSARARMGGCSDCSAASPPPSTSSSRRAARD